MDLDGTSVSQNIDDTNAFYGSSHTFDEVLKGDVPTPESAKSFVKTVAKYAQNLRSSNRLAEMSFRVGFSLLGNASSA